MIKLQYGLSRTTACFNPDKSTYFDKSVLTLAGVIGMRDPWALIT